jgi:dehydrogenase/reductase SDR family member 12
MARVPLKKLLTFYVRFTPNYTGIGYVARRPFWRRLKPDFSGQTWLVIGGSEGIGGAAARAAADNGAKVIVVARDIEKLRAFAASVKEPGNVSIETADFSLQSDIRALLERLQLGKPRINVLINNVGIQKHIQTLTPEGFEFSFATNLQGHYLLTRELLDRGLLADDAVVIEVSSGGMYNHPLNVKDLNITGPGYLGVRAYGLAKRGQVVLTRYWREKYAATRRSFYVMHPGWVDTASVGRSMPRFRAILKSVLRSHKQGADTIVWLAATRPAQSNAEAIWFDRKERGVHIYAHTPKSNDKPADLVAALEANTHRQA